MERAKRGVSDDDAAAAAGPAVTLWWRQRPVANSNSPCIAGGGVWKLSVY